MNSPYLTTSGRHTSISLRPPPGARRPRADRGRSEEALRLDVSHTESGRVSAADVVEDATGTRIINKINHRFSLTVRFFFSTRSFSRDGSAGGLLTAALKSRASLSSRSRIRKRRIYSHGCISDVELAVWFYNCAERSARPAARAWNIMTQYLLLSVHNENIIGPGCHT